MLMNQWAIDIQHGRSNWRISLPESDEFPDAILSLEEMKGLYKLLGEAIDEQENNLGRSTECDICGAEEDLQA